MNDARYSEHKIPRYGENDFMAIEIEGRKRTQGNLRYVYEIYFSKAAWNVQNNQHTNIRRWATTRASNSWAIAVQQSDYHWVQIIKYLYSRTTLVPLRRIPMVFHKQSFMLRLIRWIKAKKESTRVFKDLPSNASNDQVLSFIYPLPRKRESIPRKISPVSLETKSTLLTITPFAHSWEWGRQRILLFGNCRHFPIHPE